MSDYRRMIFEAIERALSLVDNCAQPLIETEPAGGWVIEVNAQEAQAISDAINDHVNEVQKRATGVNIPSCGGPFFAAGSRVILHPDPYMPPGMMRALPYAVWERRMQAEHEKWAREHPEAWGLKP